jgi:hypothetical protein
MKYERISTNLRLPETTEMNVNLRLVIDEDSVQSFIKGFKLPYVIGLLQGVAFLQSTPWRFEVVMTPSLNEIVVPFRSTFEFCKIHILD